MKIYYLSVFIVILNFSFGLVGGLGLVKSDYPNEVRDQIQESIILSSLAGGESVTFLDLLTNPSTYADIFNLLFALFYQTTMGLPALLSSSPFDWPGEIVALIMASQIIIYGAGIISIFRGISIE